MLFVQSKDLKPGMILALDLTIYNKYNFKTLLLKDGQPLNSTLINKINDNDISGVYVKNENQGNIADNMDEKYEGELFVSTKDIFYRFKLYGIIDKKLMWDIDNLAEELVTQTVLNKMLLYKTLKFTNYEDYFFQHCLNVCILCISLGNSLGYEYKTLKDIAVAALLHDIAMLEIPEEIIYKSDKLNEDDVKHIKQHPIIAVKKFKSFLSNDILRSILNHHEHVDGTGYPYGLKENQIHTYGKIIAVCDTFQALGTDFYHRKAKTPKEIHEYILKNINTKFDPHIAMTFLENIILYREGEYVSLNNNKTALVHRNNTNMPLRPIVKLINPDGTTGEEIDLSHEENIDTEIIKTGHSYEYMVSSCLCGEKVRYDGNVKTNETIKNLIDNNRAIMICPEILGGMIVPRLPCEIINGRVINIAGDDKTKNYVDGAIIALETAKKLGIKKAILKEKSPSCGSKCIYDGTFSKTLIPGEGITTRLLRMNNIEVISDEEF